MDNIHTIGFFEGYDNLMEILQDYYEKEIGIEDINLFMDYLISINYSDIKFLTDWLGIVDSLHKYDISSYDFNNLGNLGYVFNTRDLIYFDIGFGKFTTKNLTESLPKFYFDDEKELFELFNIPKRELGHGGNGIAYHYGDKKVLKTTIDDTEVYNCQKLLLIEIPNIVYIHDVYEYELMGLETKWCIIQDKVDTTDNTKNEIKSRYININNIFKTFK